MNNATMMLVDSNAATAAYIAVGTLAVGGAVFASSVFVLTVLSFAAPPSDDASRLETVWAALAAFALASLAPLITALNAARELASRAVSQIVNNWAYYLALLAFIFVASIITYFYPELWHAVYVPYTYVLVPAWRTVILWFFVALETFVATAAPAWNYVAMRLSRDIVAGAVFDTNVCPLDTWQTFVRALALVGERIGSAFATWARSDALTRGPPNFEPAGVAFADALATLNTFVSCSCPIVATILGPLFVALRQGRQLTTAAEPPLLTSAFACAITAPLNITFSLGTDIVRPIARGVRPSSNNTNHAFYAALNCTLTVFDDVVFQYWETLIGLGVPEAPVNGTRDTNSVPGQLWLTPPPRIAAFGAPYVWSGRPPFAALALSPLATAIFNPESLARMVLYSPAAWHTALEWLFHVDLVFTTWDGQLYWRLDEVYDAFRDTTGIPASMR